MKFLYSKPFVEKIEKELLKKTRGMKTPPVLAIVLAGDDPASLNYIKRKEQTAKKLGCEVKLSHFPPNAGEFEMITLIRKINADKLISGIIVQLPLPAKFNTDKIISTIKKNKDVDNLRGSSPFVSPAVQAIWMLLNAEGKPPKKANVLIIGYGQTIGKPMHTFLLKKKFTNIEIADKKTKNLPSLIKKADIIISGAGQANLIKNIKKDAIVIDAGASLHKGKIVGDVDLKRIAKKAKLVTPVPGGVGPLTVVYLFKNLASSAI